MKKILHLQQHRHTGKLITHKHTSYRGLFVLVALFGLAVAFIQQSVVADDIVVTAKVSAPIPSQAAVIESPLNNSVVTTATLSISGTCEQVTPVSVVEIYIDSIFSTSTPCSGGGTFLATVTLDPGKHTIYARTVSVTGDYGPDSNTIVITYTKPQAATQAAPANSSQPQSGQKTALGSEAASNINSSSSLIIASIPTFLIYGPAKDALWSGSITGGTGLYTTTIDWGDGSSTTYKNIVAGPQTFSHRYTTFKPYLMTMTVVDSSGHSLSQRLAVITPYIEPSIGSAHDSTNPISALFTYLMFITISTLVLLGTLITIHSSTVRHLKVVPVRVQHRSRSRKR